MSWTLPMDHCFACAACWCDATTRSAWISSGGASRPLVRLEPLASHGPRPGVEMLVPSDRFIVEP